MSLPPWRQAYPVQTMHGQPPHASRHPAQHTQIVPSAFTSVGARRGFDDSPAMTSIHPNVPSTTPYVVPTDPKPAPSKKITWPQEVRDYVQRSFDSDAYIAGIEKEEIESRLKIIINSAAETGDLYNVDWKHALLPQQLIQKERQEALSMSTQSQFGSFVAGNQTAYSGNANLITFSADRKRKSGDVNFDEVDVTSNPPWRQSNARNLFEDRLTYANQEQADRLDKRQRKLNDKAGSKYNLDLEKRRQRFQTGKSNTASERKVHRDSPDPADQGPVVGTCQTLEKKYFRLTSAPKPEAVRPLHILEQTLELLKKKWRSEGNYGYVCDQFKSLRQDLTVQHIRNEFTVTVYEIHARIALEKGDLGEYNQCQTQLRALYSEKLGGHPAEFLAYRILYFIHTNNRSSMNDVLADLTQADKQKEAVAHALKVRTALALGNYHKFFQLYLTTPNMGAYLMDTFVRRERLAALANIFKSYKPSVLLRFITEELGFESDAECVQFVCDYGGEHLLEQKDAGIVKLLCGQSFNIFETARAAAFRKVDIKGQI